MTLYTPSCSSTSMAAFKPSRTFDTVPSFTDEPLLAAMAPFTSLQRAPVAAAFRAERWACLPLPFRKWLSSSLTIFRPSATVSSRALSRGSFLTDVVPVQRQPPWYPIEPLFDDLRSHISRDFHAVLVETPL